MALVSNMEDSLSKRTVSALTWRASSSFVLTLSQFVVSIVMARVLLPEAFGLMSMALVVTSSVALVSEIGIAPALIQRPDLSPEHVEAGFTITILFGLTITVLLFLCAPLSGLIFGTAELVGVVRVLALGLFIRSLSSVSEALLQRRLRFKTLFRVEAAAYLIGSGVIGVTCAVAFRSVWALVAGAMAETTLRAILLLFACPPPRRPRLSRSSSSPLLRFGFGMSLARIANFAARNGDNFVVGRFLGAEAVGLYTRSYQLMVIPATYSTTLLNTVLFPVYSEIQKEPRRIRQIYTISMLSTCLMAIPLLLLMIAIAPELIVGLYGQNWAGSVVPFQILCVGGIARAIYPLGDALLRGTGHVYVQLRVHTAYAILIIGGAFIGLSQGIAGVAVCVTFALFVTLFVMMKFVSDVIQISYSEVLGCVAPGTVLGLVGMASAMLAKSLVAPLALPNLMLAAVMSVAAGAGIILSLLLGAHQLLGDLYLPAVQQLRHRLPLVSRIFVGKAS